MQKLTKEIKLFTPDSKPTPSNECPTLSIDVYIIDEEGLSGLGYYDFNSCQWRFHTDTLVDYEEEGNKTKWRWYYPPVSIYDINF